MAPRFQCLNAAARQLAKQPAATLSFSTSSKALANNKSTNELSSLLESTSTSSPGFRRVNFSNNRQDAQASEDSHGRPATAAPQNPFSAGARRTPTRFSNNISVGNADSVERVRATLASYNSRKGSQQNSEESTVETLAKRQRESDLTKQISRRWQAGDLYAPHDLSAVEMIKWKRRGKPTMDPFDVLRINPLEEYKNFSIMSEYITPMGRIKHSRETGLRPVNQRRIAKAIRRVVGMGMMPSVHRHPMILQSEANRRQQNGPNSSFGGGGFRR